jgi:adenylyltransferase/sulfurtransferase
MIISDNTSPLPQPTVVDRFDRLKRIGGWDQDRLTAARVMVVGAGALGNEILKNLALVGVGHIFVIDPDRIDTTNLTRSPLFRPEDVGRYKAVSAAEEVKEIWPQVKVQYVIGRVGSDVGWGVLRRMNVVLGGVDNRRARLDISRVCWKVGVPYVDAGLDKLDGSAVLFYPGKGPCYECTLSTREIQLLDQEYNCLGVSIGSRGGAVAPTAPTTSAIMAGIQTQITLKLLHGWNPDEYCLPGRSVRYHGSKDLFEDLYYKISPTCDTHQRGTVPENRIIQLPEHGARNTSAREMLDIARRTLGADCSIDFAAGDDRYRQLISLARCNECNQEEPLLSLLSRFRTDQQKCPRCGKPRYLKIDHRFSGDQPYLDKQLIQLGIPPLHWIPVRKRSDENVFYFELAGDERDLFASDSMDGHLLIEEETS